MKVSELKIGNYLNGRKGPVTVTEIRENNRVKIKENPSNFTVRDCLHPIPLTEEWLQKLGFQQVRPCYLVHNGFEAGLDGDDFANCMWTIIISKALPVKIKYVHQLQNLYFAITGGELTLKP